MADPFVAEIRIFPFNFPPTGWAWCDGQLMPISQNTALFALVGTYYGGDGKSIFALPNLQGRAAMHPGQGAGLSAYDVGQEGGSATVTLLESEMPLHSHTMNAAPTAANDRNPDGKVLARSVGGNVYIGAAPQGAMAKMSPQAIAPTGGSQPHNNMQPYLTCYFCIALQGVFPPRS